MSDTQLSPEDITKYGKWAVFAALLGGILYMVVPILLGMAIDIALFVMVAIFLFAVFMFLPAISEYIAQVSYRSWEYAIKKDPVTRVKRDIQAHAKEIDGIETMVSQAGGQIGSIEDVIKTEKDLSEEDRKSWMEELDGLKERYNQLVELRNSEIIEYQKSQKALRKLELDWKIGSAMQGVLGIFSISKKTGRNSQGFQIAADEIRNRLNTSKAKMDMIASRPTGQKVPALPMSKDNLVIELPRKTYTPITIDQ